VKVHNDTIRTLRLQVNAELAFECLLFTIVMDIHWDPDKWFTT